MNFVAGLYEKAFKKVSTLDALIKIIDSLRKHAKKGFCGDLLKGLGSNSGNKGEFSFQVQDARRSCGVLQRSIPVPFSTITSRIFRTFFWGSPGQVLLCLKSGHHGRLSRVESI